MCGIAGCFSPGDVGSSEPRAARVDRVAAMSHGVRHRGPDASGLWQSSTGECVLAHRRLSIIDLDPRSNQPMVTADGVYALTYNGELYNYLELRQQLIEKGWQFATESDTEVVLAALVIWGDAALQRMDGMFALAFFNSKSGVLLLARDRCGEKPLYYARSADGTIWFCSELKPLARHLPEGPVISETGLCAYLLLRYVPAPDTILANVSQLEAGAVLKVNRAGQSRTERWYGFSRSDVTGIDEKVYVQQVEEHLVTSIRRRIRADVPVGLFLSSGVDSSLVAALTARRLGIELNAFSAGFAGVDKDETEAAARIARHLNLPFQAMRINEQDLLEALPNFGQYLDEPNGDRSCVPVYLLSRLMRQHVTVAISGDGGDELFAGYDRYLKPAALPPVNCPPAYQGVLGYHAHQLKVFPMQLVATLLPAAFNSWCHQFADRHAVEFLIPNLPAAQVLRVHDLNTYLPGAVLAKVDRLAMRHALEVRTPFLSPELLMLSAALPDSLLSQGEVMKLTLRTVLRRYLPDELIYRGKLGFGMPPAFISKHGAVFNQLFQHADQVLQLGLAGMGHGVLDGLRTWAPRHINSLWAFIVLGLWLEDLVSDPA